MMRLGGGIFCKGRGTVRAGVRASRIAGASEAYFDYYRLSDVERISNPDATLYQLPAFGLGRTNFWLQPLSLSVWRGRLKGALFKYGIGLVKEDGYQMPGVFLLKDGQIARAFRHRSIADEPDYLKLAGGV
jgi:hypothetical protein